MGLIKILLNIVALILSISYFISYKKTNELEDYIAYWGWMLMAIFF